jgi:hypothetical protein
MKILSAVAILSTAFAAPVFAQSAIGPGYGSQPVTNYRGAYDQTFRGAYDQSGAPFYRRGLTDEERRNVENFGFSGRDPSRVGGEDPSLHPAN